MRFSIFTSYKCPSKLWVTRSPYDISLSQVDYLEIRSALDKFNNNSGEDLRFRTTIKGKLHTQLRLCSRLTDLSTRLSLPSRSPPAVT